MFSISFRTGAAESLQELLEILATLRCVLGFPIRVARVLIQSLLRGGVLRCLYRACLGGAVTYPIGEPGRDCFMIMAHKRTLLLLCICTILCTSCDAGFFDLFEISWGAQNVYPNDTTNSVEIALTKDGVGEYALSCEALERVQTCSIFWEQLSLDAVGETSLAMRVEFKRLQLEGRKL